MTARGMVLISVLWVILVLSVLSFSLAAAVRLESVSVQQSFDSERAFFMAKGAAEVVYASLAKNEEIPGSPIRRENGQFVFPFDSGEARVSLETGSGFIDLNAASDELLASMFDSLGVEEARRNRLVDCILDWRDSDDIPHLYGAEVNDYPARQLNRPSVPRNAPFQSIDELLFVRNMTPELFYGSIRVDADTGAYKRVPGIRELVTVISNVDKVDPNEASFDVLMALPSMTSELAQRILESGRSKRFSSADDLVRRAPELASRAALSYFTFEEHAPAVLTSRATVFSSGVSRTIRMLFNREQRVLIMNINPLMVRRVEEIRFNRWRFE